MKPFSSTKDSTIGTQYILNLKSWRIHDYDHDNITDLEYLITLSQHRLNKNYNLMLSDMMSREKYEDLLDELL